MASGSTYLTYYDSKYVHNYYVIANKLNIRDGASTGNKSIGILNYGDLVKCEGYYNEDWLYVNTGKLQGFVKFQYLSTIRPSTRSAEESKSTKYLTQSGLAVQYPQKADGTYFNESELILVKTNIGGYFFDGFMRVSHQIRTNITSHQVQKGVSVSDHAFLDPVEITMEIRMSDAMKGLVEEQFGDIAYTRSVAAFRILRDLQRNRIPVRILTRLDEYQNMIIKDLSVEDSVDTLNGLICNVTMQELIVAEEKTVKVSTRTQTTTTSDSGTVSASDLSNQSILNILAGFMSQTFKSV